MRLRLALLLALIASPAMFGQIVDEQLRSIVSGIKYPPLAETARVMGAVKVAVNTGEVTVISGSPLFRQTAVDAANRIATLEDDYSADITVHFALAPVVTSSPVTVSVKRGNAFERVLLRTFGRKTEKQITAQHYRIDDAPPNTFRIGGNSIEIWIFGRLMNVLFERNQVTAGT